MINVSNFNQLVCHIAIRSDSVAHNSHARVAQREKRRRKCARCRHSHSCRSCVLATRNFRIAWRSRRLRQDDGARVGGGRSKFRKRSLRCKQLRLGKNPSRESAVRAPGFRRKSALPLRARAAGHFPGRWLPEQGQRSCPVFDRSTQFNAQIIGRTPRGDYAMMPL